MANSTFSNRLEYVELYCDSTLVNQSGAQGVDSKNWPVFNFNKRSFRLAGMKVLECEIPYVFDTLVSTTSQVNVFVSPNNYVINVPSGNYTGTTLATALKNELLTVIGAGWNVTYDPDTIHFLITYTGAFEFYWPSALATFLGFERYTTSVSAGNQIVSTKTAKPTGPLYISLNSTTFGSTVQAFYPDNNNTNSTQVIARIPITVQQGAVITYRDSSPMYMFDLITNTEISTFDLYLSLGDEDYTYPLDLEGLGFSCKLGLLVYRAAGVPITGNPNNQTFIP
jgi:hypothetical protein